MVSKVLLCSYYSVVGDCGSIPSIAVQLLPVLKDFFNNINVLGGC